MIIWITLYFLDAKKVKYIVNKNRIIMWLNEISYMTYLLQLNIGLLVMYYIKEKITKNSYFIVIAGILSTLIVSTILHYGIENKIHMVLDKVYKKQKCKQ